MKILKKLFLCLLFVCLLSSRSWAAFGVVASSCDGQTAGDGSDLTSSAIDTTGADLLILWTSYFEDFESSATVSDSKSNTWTGLTEFGGNENSSRSRMWYSWGSPSVGASHTFTLSKNGGIDLFRGLICVLALSGAQTASDPLDGSDVTNENTATTIQPGTITPSVMNEIVVTGVASSASDTDPTINSGFTIAATYSEDDFNGDIGGIAYQIQTTATAVNPTWDVTFTLVNRAAMASFKPPAAAAPVRRRPILFQ